MYTTNNNFKVFVSNVTTSNTVTGVDLTAIEAGEIVILGDGDAALDNASDTITGANPSSIKFAQKTSTGITHFSDRFKVKDIISMSYAAGYASTYATLPTEQISYVGYNGVSGAIQAIDYNEYILSLIYKHDDMMWSEQINIKPYLVTTESGASALTVTQSFADLINNDSYSKVKADLVCNFALNTAYDMTNAITVVNGSNILNVASDLTYNAASGTLAVGDYIRLALTNITCALTNPVYKVTAIDTLQVTLDRPVTSASGAYADAQDSSQVIPAASFTSAVSVGLKLTGLSLDWTAKGIFPYKQVTFDLGLKGFGTTTQSATGPVFPVGYYKAVSDLEWFSQFGSDGLRNATQHPVPTGRSETSPLITYNCWTIRYKGTAENDAIVGMSNLTSTIYIFAPYAVSTILTTNMLTPLAALAGVPIN